MSDLDRTDSPQYGRSFFGGADAYTIIGNGQVGGKASGLDLIRKQILPAINPTEFPEFEVVVPTMTVLTTNVFEEFITRNGLCPEQLAKMSDDRIAYEFQQADFPAEHVGDLWGVVDNVHTPLAVRSSSLLEDALAHPLAGVYGTKMTPNNQTDVDTRFSRLVEAIKFVYASTYFRQARSYLRSIDQSPQTEKMAVIIQEVVGERFGDRYYPQISGVARSYNYYPTGHAKPGDGVVNLALGLGRQIVDGGLSWTYSPAYPDAPAPFGNVSDLLKNTQTEFWTVNMGQPPLPDPIHETEYLASHSLLVAEGDDVLNHLVSTYDHASNRMRPGLPMKGPRVLDFSPILSFGTISLNDLIQKILAVSEESLGAPVEIEFAIRLPKEKGQPIRFGFLQVRPMMVTKQSTVVSEAELEAPQRLLSSVNVMGNGSRDDIYDIVYLKPRAFEARHTPRIAQELETINRGLVTAADPYLLIGFGRWGSSDPWLGVPVEWGQISGARVIVETTQPEMNPDLSQGSHFFHNLIGFKVLYLSVKHHGSHLIDWEWLDRQDCVAETDFVRHIRLRDPLQIRVDGIHNRGVVTYHE
jgi:Pyruvate phosphate dikinase, AMP/ATP-binding domain